MLVIIEKRVVCNESFEKLLMKHFKSRGEKFGGIKEKYVDDAFKDAQYVYADVEVECNTTRELSVHCEHIGDPVNYFNHEDSASEEEFNKDVEYAEEVEHTTTNCSEWNVTGGLSITYQGAGASTSIGYTRGQSQIVRISEGRKQTQLIRKVFSVPPKHHRSAVVIQQYQRKECKVKNVKLIFPKNAKIKCKFSGTGSDKIKKDAFFIKEVLKDYIEDKGADPLTATLEGKYVWDEICIFLDVSKPEPLSG